MEEIHATLFCFAFPRKAIEGSDLCRKNKYPTCFLFARKRGQAAGSSQTFDRSVPVHV